MTEVPKSVFQLGKISLRSNKAENFTEININELIDQNEIKVVQLMRSIDKLRKYNPSNDECTALNIPNSRLNMDKASDIIALSGGFKGVRFSNEDMKFIMEVTRTLGTIGLQLDGVYGSASKAEKYSDESEVNYLQSFHESANTILKVLVQVQDFVKKKQAEITSKGY